MSGAKPAGADAAALAAVAMLDVLAALRDEQLDAARACIPGAAYLTRSARRRVDAIAHLERPDRRSGTRGTRSGPRASQLLHGLYDETTWAPIALGALGLVVALAVAAPRLPPLPLLAPLLGLWLWSLVSSDWSDSTDAALASANRWLLYGAAIVVLAWALARDRRRAPCC